MFTELIAQVASPDVSQLTSFGAAGMMSAMWLWERNNSRTREEQLTEAHARVMNDRVQLAALVELVRQNTQAMSRLAACVEQLRDVPTPSATSPARKEPS